MLFNSLQFAVFFLTVYTLYLVLDHKWQNRLLLVASYVFYGFWNWRFLFLIFISTVLDYTCGIQIDESEHIKRKRLFLLMSLLGNLSILWFFKYYDFFAVGAQQFLRLIGFSVSPHLLRIILPVGISFYTFKTLSYTIDIYRGQMKPTKHFLDYALFIAFFPHLVAGPIERASRFLPQIAQPRTLTSQKFYEGCFLIFWGLFQKVFIADSLGQLIVDPVFTSPAPYNGIMVLLASYGFAFQLYCDFSGYSDIARGLGNLMGFETMVNFNAPFFATNVQEFWNRWHISLSSWVKDYIYMPLFFAMNKMNGTLRLYLSLVFTMVLLGLWHGARLTYLVYGLYYGILLVIYAVTRDRLGRWFRPKSVAGEKVWYWLRVLGMFQITALGMLPFRANSITQVSQMLRALMTGASFVNSAAIFSKMVFVLWPLWVVQFFQYRKNDPLVVLRTGALMRAVFYCCCFYLLILYGVTDGKEFIYFQF